MPKCIIDGREVEFTPGENLIEVAKRAGSNIPFFCYHPGLSVVAQCRMCAVEIEKMPKLQTACSTPAAEGMVVKTKSPRTLQNQNSVMEFLLINHPLDCPICDKAGECDLQDLSFDHGDAYSRYTEERRTYLDLDMGPVIKKNMNRCIHCTRCIRFAKEFTGIDEMVALKRGNNTEISTIDGGPLQTEYAGNYADICPTGSLTIKDFRFKKRVWMLKKTPTICEGCSRGCNMEVHEDSNVIHRCIPRENQAINKFWMCDEGRFNFRYVNDPERIITPRVENKDLDWKSSIDSARQVLKGKKVTVLVGSDLTQEEGKILLEFVPKYLSKAELFHYGTPDVISSQDDQAADQLLKRTSKTSNLHGLEKLGFKGFKALPSDTEAVLVIRGGRAVLPNIVTTQGKGPKNLPIIGIGVFKNSEAENFSTILPGTSFAEKDGTIVNFQGTEQKLRRAILPPGQSKALPEILMIWANQKSAPGAA